MEKWNHYGSANDLHDMQKPLTYKRIGNITEVDIVSRIARPISIRLRKKLPQWNFRYHCGQEVQHIFREW